MRLFSNEANGDKCRSWSVSVAILFNLLLSADLVFHGHEEQYVMTNKSRIGWV